MRPASAQQWVARIVAAGSGLVLAGCPAPQRVFTEPMTLGGQVVSAEVLNMGARVYAMRCSSCHGHDGSGNGPSGGGFREKPRDFRFDEFRYKSTPGRDLPIDEDLAEVIRNGRVDNGMPAWPAITDEDLHAVVQYIKTFSPRFTETPTGHGAPAAAEEPAP